MPEITQKLGFDVAQAIAALDQLDGRLNRLNTSLASLSSRGLSNFNRSAAQSKQALQGIATASSTASAAARRSQASVTTLGISYQTLARIITVQLIQRALGALTRVLGQSIQDAIQFQQVVAEIATIDPRGGQGFAQIADEVRALSDAFGADLGDVGRGLYQTISNQIARTGTEAERAAISYQFLSTTIRLSVAGVTSVENATNLLSGTINAFGENAASAERIAAQFFKTVELGRTTITELANSFGTVAPIAGQLGVSIEELQAAFTTITIGGLDTAKSATQIRGVLNALIKPTKEMKVAFEELGVANGEQLVELFGFQGGLEAVIGTTDGTTQAIARLIPRVRGLSGALRLATKEGGRRFREDLEDIIRANEELLLDQKLSIILETDSRQLTNDLNRVRNFLTQDFGEDVIRTLNDIVQAVGGLDNVLSAFKGILAGGKAVLPVLAGLVPIIAVLGTRSLLASRQVGLLGKSFGILGAAAAAVALGNFIGDQLTRQLDAATNEFNASLDAQTEGRRRAAEIQQEIEIAKNKLILADFKALVASEARENSRRIRNARQTATRIAEANKSAFQSALDISEDIEKRLRNVADSREDQARDALENIRDAETDLRDARFEQQTRTLTDQQRFFATERRLAQEQQRVRQQLASVPVQQGDDTALSLLREQQSRVQDLARDLDSLADRTGDRGLQFRADQAIQRGLQTRIQLERRLIQIITQRRAAEQAAAQQVAANNELARAAFRELIEAQEATADPNLSEEIRDNRFEEFARKRIAFLKLISENAQIGARELADFSRIFGSQRFNIAEELGPQTIRQLSISDEALQRARQQLSVALEGAAANISVELKIALRAAGVEGELSRNRIVELVTQAFNEEQAIKELQSNIDVFTQDAAAAIEGFDIPSIIDRLNQILNEDSGNIELTNFKALIDRFNVQAVQAIRDGVLSDEELALLQERAAEVTKVFAEIGAAPGGRLAQGGIKLLDAESISLFEQFTSAILRTAQATEELKQKQLELEATRRESTFGDDRIRQDVLDSVEAAASRQEANRQAAEAAADEVGRVNQVGQAGVQAATGLSSMTTSINRSIQAVVQLQSALNNLTPPNLNAPVQTAALGKKIAGFAKGGLIPRYFDKGGFASRGTDTIPAMLSPGEYVVNARSTRRFFSQLQSMNAGIRPVFRQDGGPVTNVGDINVTVRDGKDATGTGRTIARSIQRELRRRTSQL